MALLPGQCDVLNSILAGRLVRLRTRAGQCHPAEPAFEAVDAACRRFVRCSLQRVESALKRLADGTIDTCDVCGRAIPFEQLLANPTRHRCEACVGAACATRRHASGARQADSATPNLPVPEESMS